MCESVPPNAGDDDDDGWAIVEETAVATGDRGTATAVATSAKTYSTVLAIAATDVLEAAWHAMGGQKAHWPLRINLLYPFVEASEFATTAVTLRDAPDQILPLFEVRSQRALSPLVFDLISRRHFPPALGRFFGAPPRALRLPATAGLAK